MTATAWTVVLRKSKFATMFSQTGFSGTWDEAAAEAARIAADLPDTAQVYYVPTTDTAVLVDQLHEPARWIKIAPTKEQKAAAAARAEAIRHMLATDTQRGRGWSALAGFSRRLASEGIEYGDLFATAAYAVDRGMTWSDVCRTQA